MSSYRERALNSLNNTTSKAANTSTTSSYRQRALNRQQKIEEPKVVEPQITEEENKIIEGAKLVSQAQNLMKLQQQRLMNGIDNLKDYAQTLPEEKINQLKEESPILNPELAKKKDADARYYALKFALGTNEAVENIADATVALGSNLSKAQNKVLEGITSVGGLLPNKVSEHFKNEAEELQRIKENAYANDFLPNKELGEILGYEYEPNKGQALAGDVLGGVGGMLPTIATNLLVPGAGYAVLGLQGAGGGTKQAYEKTGNLGAKEEIYGLLSGLSEIAVEKLSGGIGGLGNGAVDDIASKLIKNGFIRNATGEGIEEAVTTIIDPYLQRLTYDKGAEGAKASEVLRSAIVGSLTSMLLQGGAAAVNLPQTIQQNKENRAEIRNSLEGIEKMLPTYENVSKTASTEKNAASELPTMASQQAMLPTNQTEGKTAQNGNIEQIAEMSKMPANFMQNRPTYEVEIEKILPFMDDRMGYRESDKVEKLKESIKKNGIETPIELRTNANGEVTINDGHHRLQIAKELGIKNIPVRYLDENSQKTIEADTFKEYNTPIDERWGTDVDGIGRNVSGQNQGSGITEENGTHTGTLSDRTDTTTENDRLYREVQRFDNRPSSDTTRGENIAGQTINEADTQSAFFMPAEDIIEEGINANKISYNESIYRNVRRALGEKGYQYFKENILDKLDAAKLDNVNMKNEIANELKNYVVDELGIKKDSKESELVQKYGEKEITLDELKEATPNWENVVKADKWFRNMYDKLIDAINKSRLEIYPYVEEKIEAVELELKVVKQKIQEIKENGVASYKKDSKIQLQIDNLKERINAKNEFLSKQENKDTLAYKDAERVKVEAEERLADLQDLLDVRAENTLYKLEAKEKKLQEMLDSEELWRGKRIPKRKDYYRHFQEMTEGFEALGNILATPAEISSSLSGISENTKPNAKWLGLAQRRLGNKTKYDAVGGFLNYLDSASYAINIDPEIKRIRDFTEEIRKASKDNTTANRLIEYLTDYANDLAGKTNPMDRYLQKIIPGGRKTMRAIGWLTNRIKSNAVLGNFNSAAAQILNLPQGLADIKYPKNIAIGIMNTVSEPFVKSNRYKDSQFINERFNSDIYSQFDEKLINQPKKMAVWMLGALDELGTKTIWNGEYSKAVDLGIKDPVRYADYRTRDLVAGRGIGELSLNQKSKTIGLLAPFTVEVSNYWGVVKDFVDAKDFGAIILLQVFGFLFNKGLEELGISAGTVDFIDAAIDAANTEGGIDKKIGRIAGEYLSNSMFGQQFASIYPENGADLGVYKLPTRSELFGDADPTRMGTGSVLSKAITNPVTSVVLPWGGTQVNKTVQGLSTFTKGGSYSKDAEGKGKLKYPVEQNASNLVKSALFGKWSTPGARDYIDRGFKPLSANQTEAYEKAMKAGISDDDFFKVYDATRGIEGDKDRSGKTIENSKSKKLKEAIDKATPKLTSKQRKILYDAFNVSKTVQGGNGLPTASDFKVTLPKVNIKVEK